MIVRIIDIQVKPEATARFEAETKLNHTGSVADPGVLRFDVLKDDSAAGSYVLYEVYQNDEAVAAHKQAAHYTRWNDAVSGMMAAPRTSRSFEAVAPVDPSSWKKG